MRKYTGTYKVISPNGPVSGRVFIANGKLFLQAHGGPKLELIAERENHFFDRYEDIETDVEFELNKSGKVEKIVLSRNGITMSGRKE
jgi:hypothetical protein